MLPPRSMLGPLLGALVLLGAETGPSQALDGGTPTRQGDPLASAAVAVGTINADTGRLGLNHCSGVLVGRDLVLTAAHCVRDNLLTAAVLLYDGSKPAGAVQWAARVATAAVPQSRIGADDVIGLRRDLSQWCG